LGLPDGVVSRALGNTVATNLHSYRQTTDQLTREAFRETLWGASSSAVWLR